MPLYLFYTMVQKSQKWPKTQIKGVLPYSVTLPYNWKKNQRAMVIKLPVVVLSCIIFEMMWKNPLLTMLISELQLIANDLFSRFLAFLLIFWQFFTFISKSNPVRPCFCGFFFFIHVFCVLLPKIIDVARWFIVQRLWLVLWVYSGGSQAIHTIMLWK